jgi:hypothetical protein
MPRFTFWAAAAAISAGLLAACATGDQSYTPDTQPDASSNTDGGADGWQPDERSGGDTWSTLDAATPDASLDGGGSAFDAVSEQTADGSVDAATEAAVDAGAEASGEAGVDAGADASNDAPTTQDGAIDGSVDGGCTLTSCGARSVCATGGCVAARRAFVSSTVVQAAFGGYAGADTKCQQLAVAAGLGGTWMAWVSDKNSSPSARFTQATVPYALVTGTVVAPSWSGLTSGTLAHGIDSDEYGQAVAGTTEVWTATWTDGTLLGDGCSSFTAVSSSTVEVGISGKSDSKWTDVYAQFCNRTVHLYCIEQ